MTGPSLYRFVDAVKPTLVIDEADDLFVRKSDLKHIINAGWTRGAKIPRQVNINKVWRTVYFDPFTPKMIALLGRNLPAATRSRGIELRMLPKRFDEEVDSFSQLDDPEFAVLRRKFARWAMDHAAALKTAQPVVPSGFNNRAAMNWTLLLAIAELAGGDWPERARQAAQRLTRSGRRASDGVQLLAAIRIMLAGKKVITSKTIVAELLKDPTDIWVAYNHGGAVTQRQVAHLLSAYDIRPDTVHPSGRSDDSPKGYKAAQFTDAFARYLPNDPHIRTLTESDRPKLQRHPTRDSAPKATKSWTRRKK
jgi:putative DNA primase/helicase